MKDISPAPQNNQQKDNSIFFTTALRTTIFDLKEIVVLPFSDQSFHPAPEAYS